MPNKKNSDRHNSGSDKVTMFKKPFKSTKTVEDLSAFANYILDEQEELNVFKRDVVKEAAEAAKSLMEAGGVDLELEMSGHFMTFLKDFEFGNQYNEEYLVFQAEDDGKEYSMFMEITQSDEDGVGITFCMTRDNDGKIDILSEDGWEAEKSEDIIGISRRLCNVVAEQTAESKLLIAYIADSPDGGVTDEDWEEHVQENRKLLSLGKEFYRLTSFTVESEQALLVPATAQHSGIAIGYRDGKYRLYQYMDPMLLFSDEEKDERFEAFNWPENLVSEVAVLKSVNEAKQIIRDHFDRYVDDDVIFTVPLSKSLILHMDDRLFKDPDRVIRVAESLDSSRKWEINASRFVSYMWKYCVDD